MSFTTSDLRVATRVQRRDERDDGTYGLDVPDGWQQGRGAFGGLVMSALARAVIDREPDATRSLRSMTGEIVGPVQPGPCEIRVEALRIGNGVSTWQARLTQGAEVLAAATLVMGRARKGAESFGPPIAERPTMPPWSEAKRLWRPDSMPTFVQHLDLRPTSHPPYAGAPERRAEGWVRALVRPERLDAADLIALADAWWPSYFAALSSPRPMATIGFTLQLLVDPATLDPEAPLFHRAHAPAGADGYVIDLRELWSADGRLIALNPQTFVVIK